MNCSAASMSSAPLSSAMTACRSSRAFAETRTSSPWICVLTPFGPSSRMSLVTFFAISEDRPSLIEASRRYSLPDGLGSPSPVSSALREMLRLMSLVWNTSRTARTRSSEFAAMTIFSPLHAIEAPTPLKSYRCAISLMAWFSALSTSWRSTLLTTSNDDSLAMTPPDLWCSGAAVPTTGRFRNRPEPLLSFHPHPGDAVTEARTLAGYPSGQRGLTVNQLASPTGVRIPHPPRTDDGASSSRRAPRRHARTGLDLLRAGTEAVPDLRDHAGAGADFAPARSTV